MHHRHRPYQSQLKNPTPLDDAPAHVIPEALKILAWINPSLWPDGNLFHYADEISAPLAWLHTAGLIVLTPAPGGMIVSRRKGVA